MTLKSIILTASIIAASTFASTANAATKAYTFSIAEFMAKDENTSKLDGFQITWGKSASGEALGDISTIGRPANSYHIEVQQACEHALLNSLLALRDLAISKGASKLTGVHSSKGTDFDPSTEFVCFRNEFVAKTPLNATATK